MPVVNGCGVLKGGDCTIVRTKARFDEFGAKLAQVKLKSPKSFYIVLQFVRLANTGAWIHEGA